MKNTEMFIRKPRFPVAPRMLKVALVFISLLSLGPTAATAQMYESDTYPLLHQWVLTTPLPILLLKALGILLVAGAFSISAHLLRHAEDEDQQ
jgi:hypothetical protein